jgi:hypothetical protein
MLFCVLLAALSTAVAFEPAPAQSSEQSAVRQSLHSITCATTNVLVQVVDVQSDTTQASTTVPDTNSWTSILTQTNSLGVVTGVPDTATAQSTPLPAVTEQPAVATIPAGLPDGTTWLTISVSHTLTSFQVSVGKSTTSIMDASDDISIVTETVTQLRDAPSTSADSTPTSK